MSKIAIYCRISKDRENQKSISVQKELGKKFAITKGFEYVFYEDKGISGGGDSSKRPAYSKMLKDIKSGELDGVYVYNQDRLMREEMEWFTLMEVLLENDVKLYEDGREVDLEDESSRMMGAFKSIMDASFRRTTSKKIKASIEHNLQAGRVTGITAYGYKSGQDNMLVVDEEEAEVVRLIFNLSKTMGQTAVAKELTSRGIKTRYNKIGGKFDVVNQFTKEVTTYGKDTVKWNSSTIYAILNNKNYIGERIYGGITYKCPAIITPKLFREVQQAQENRQTGTRTGYKYLLTDIMTCGVCGSRMTGRSLRSSSNNTYRCVDKRYTNRAKRCSARDCKTNPLDYLIWQSLFVNGQLNDAIEQHLKRDNTLDELEKYEDEVAVLQKDIRAIKRRREKVIDLVIDEVITKAQSKSRMNSLEEEEKTAQSRLAKAEQMVDYTRLKIEKGDRAKFDLEKAAKNAPFDEKQKLIKKYVKDIKVLYREKVYYVRVDFHLDIDWLLFAMDTKYNVAIDGRTNTVIPISEKYKTLLKQGAKDDELINNLVRAVYSYDYGTHVDLFN